MEPQKKEVQVSFVRRYPLTEHTCPFCGKVFQAPRLRVYCSSECKQRASWERNGAEFNERRKAKQNEAERGKAKGVSDEKAD